MVKHPKTQSLWERSMGVLRVKTARSRRAPRTGVWTGASRRGLPGRQLARGLGQREGKGPDRSTRAAWRRLTGAGVGPLSTVCDEKP